MPRHAVNDDTEPDSSSRRRQRLAAGAVTLLVAGAATVGVVAAVSRSGADPDPSPTQLQPSAGSSAQQPDPEPSSPRPPDIVDASPTTGDPAGWRTIFYDDFGRNALAPEWGAYSGQPGGNPYGRWEKDNVVVGNGSLVLHSEIAGGRIVTGGVSLHDVAQTYGKWEVRLRVASSADIKWVALLWPLSERWPQDGEINFGEDDGGNRSAYSAFLHWGDVDTKIQRNMSGVDMTQWHTVGVEWTAGRIDYLLDGQVWTTIDGPNVPTKPMWLALQTEAQRYPSTTTALADLEVDWVRVYEPA
ncbi:MAG: glycosyl hydrolase family protein [Actinomycetota bacterium]|nr:MAG: glycosyl hydrolase family protein [Actinomycetota bacterium]